MIAEFEKCRLEGTAAAPPSKSAAHRLLIAAYLSGKECEIDNVAMSEDIKATINCLSALGSEISVSGKKVSIRKASPKADILNCNESGSTLRFLIPIALTEERDITFKGSKKLLERPLSVYEEIAKREGFLFEKEEGLLRVKGNLKSGEYVIRGDISSQFITGMIFALSTLKGDSVIKILPPFESRSYVLITIGVLKSFGVDVQLNGLEIKIKGGQVYMQKKLAVEGDCSNAAYVEAFNAADGNVRLTGLREDTLQGDAVYKKLFEKLEHYSEFDISDCPDLGPVLFSVAALKEGALFGGTRRLRIKESDRCEAMQIELRKLGVEIKCMENKVFVPECEIKKPTEMLYSHNDHRILMALCVLLSKTGGSIRDAQAVNKSFPDYFEVIKALGAKVNLREETY